MTAEKSKSGATLTVRQVRSGIGYEKSQKATLKAQYGLDIIRRTCWECNIFSRRIQKCSGCGVASYCCKSCKCASVYYIFSNNYRIVFNSIIPYRCVFGMTQTNIFYMLNMMT